MRKITLILFAAVLLNACDKIDDPIPADAGTAVQIGEIQFVPDPSLNIPNDSILDFINSKTWDSITGPDNSSQRFAVLEEFTGHRCRACPTGARRIEQLVTDFGDQVIPVAIHVTKEFAAPLSGNKFTSDFRLQSQEGETYRNSLNIGVLPQGVVSRTTQSGRAIDQWESDFSLIKNDNPAAVLTMKSFRTPSDSFLVRIQLEIEWLTTLPETYNLQVYALESNIIDWQLDGNDEIPDYNHKHMLRKVVNGTFGQSLEAAVAGERENFQYITTLDASWDPNNIDFVGFIFDSDASSYEIIQGNAVHLYK